MKNLWPLIVATIMGFSGYCASMEVLDTSDLPVSIEEKHNSILVTHCIKGCGHNFSARRDKNGGQTTVLKNNCTIAEHLSILPVVSRVAFTRIARCDNKPLSREMINALKSTEIFVLADHMWKIPEGFICSEISEISAEKISFLLTKSKITS